ncbi:MAG: hypothetical protein ACU841_11010 [Gammaproteobacteria bacterium]
MKRQAYIHIGLGKTGTSAIQRFLFQNKAALKAQGILYPLAGLMDSAHHGLCPLGQKIDEAHLDQVYDHLKNEIKNESTAKLVISSEHFSFANPLVVEKIWETTRAFDTKIIFYTRPQTSLIESTFLQWQKYGSDYLGDIRGFWKTHAPSFDFLKIIAPWELAFGTNNIIAKVYAVRYDARLEFSKLIDMTDIHVLAMNSERDNLSINPIFSKLICLIDNNILTNRLDIIEEIAKISSSCTLPKPALLNDIDLHEIRARYAESNDRFADRFLTREDGLVLKRG